MLGGALAARVVAPAHPPAARLDDDRGEGADALAPYTDLLADELNVKAVHFARDIAAYGTFQVQVNAKVLGPKLGADMRAVLAATQSGDWKVLDGAARASVRASA